MRTISSVMDSALEIHLRHCADLPSPPAVALRIIDLAQNPEVDLEQVAEVVSLDPAMSAKVLRIANSPFYAHQRRCHNLRQALTLLGLNAVLMLALTFSLVGTLRCGGRPAMDYSRFWRRALLSAMASRALGERLRLGRGEELFLAGLLQDIGMLALDSALPARYRTVGAPKTPHEHLQGAERQALGTDHAEVGAWLLRHWHLPEPLPQAVGSSHTPDVEAPDPETRTFLRCVALSGLFADALLSEDSAQQLADLAGLATQSLGLDASTLSEAVSAVLTQAPQVGALFEVPLLNAALAESILRQARELLLVHGLHSLQEAAALHRTADTLESRTRELEEQLRRDPLTGLYNRAYLEQALDQELARAWQYGWPVSVLFLDLDHFKQLNDTHGHLAGDRVLLAVAQLLTRQVRCTDIVARYGGEEFAVVLPGSGRAAGRVLGERIVKAVAHTPCDLGESRVQVTLSAGIASHGEGVAFERAADLLVAADRAMYEAKRRGRNQMAMLGPTTLGGALGVRCP